jgi:hypothetical protein
MPFLRNGVCACVPFLPRYRSYGTGYVHACRFYQDIVPTERGIYMRAVSTKISFLRNRVCTFVPFLPRYRSYGTGYIHACCFYQDIVPTEQGMYMRAVSTKISFLWNGGATKLMNKSYLKYSFGRMIL